MKSAIPAVIVALVLFNTFPANASVNITQSPTDQVVSLNAHVTLKVTATSTAPPITYQWYGKGELLPDQTSRTLVLNNIELDQAGEYTVVNDTDNQPVQSNPATVTVDPTFEKLTEGRIVTESANSEHASWWDPDRDGWLDVFVCHTAGPGPGVLPSFFQNNRDGTFTQITTNAIAQNRKRSLGSAVGDFDNDGDEDIYYSGNARPNSTEPRCDLFRNDGPGRFTPVTGPWQQDHDLTCDAVFVDYDQDRLLDIFVVNGHKQAACLYRQTPQGTFVKMTAAQVGSILSDAPESYNAAWADYDNDGDLDVWIENFEGHSQLHRNDGRGFFTRVTEGSIVEDITGGIGVWGDYDNDGWLDLFAGGEGTGGPYTNALHRNLQGGGFTNVAASAGVGLKMACWSAAWGDYDNDGWLDLFAFHWTEGQASRTNVLFHNRGDGTFEQVDVGSPIRDGYKRIFVTWADYDHDGFLDLFLGCGELPEEPDHLYRNNARAIGNANHWLKVKLNGQAANRSGIGAKIRVKAIIGGQEMWQVREITGNGHSAGGPGLIAHFGLGDAVSADVVRIEWPSGNVQELTDVAPKQLLTVTEQVRITPVRPSSSLGGSVTLTAQLNGTWQWYHDGGALEGQTAKTLTLSNIQATDAGRYSVVVTTASGLFTNHVYLLVDTRFEKITTGDVVNDGMDSIQGAWGDYDGDGHLDLAVTGGYWNTSGAINSALYRNEGAGSLVKVTDSPLSLSTDRGAYLAWVDYDNDGDLDLATGVHESGLAALYFNLANGEFVRQRTAAAWIANGIDVRGSGIAWGDYDADGLVDLMVINWVGGGGLPGPNRLLRGVGNGRFEVVTDSALALNNNNEEALAWIDFDGDGDLDFASVESASPQLRRLFRNLGNGQFEPLTNSPFWGERANYWGQAWADFDNDGDFDVAVCAHFADASSDALFLNDRHGNLTKANLASLGLKPDFGANPAWGDYDNDGLLDLFCTGYASRNRLYRNRGDGTFEEILHGSIPHESADSFLGCWGDYDGDGYLDLFVANDNGKNNFLYRNNHREFLAQMGQTNHWLQINLRGTKSNRSGIGAKVRVTATIGGKPVQQLRQVGGQTCAPELFAHFGLGDAPHTTTVRVEWPSGTVEEFSNLPRDQFYTIVEPSLRGAMKPDGEFELSVWASTNRNCTIEHSPNLVNWTVLTTVTGQGETPVTVTDPGALAKTIGSTA